MRYSHHWSQGRIAALRDLTPAIRLIEIAPAGGLAEPWQPGAHIDVGVMAGDRPETRSYSLIGRGEAGLYRIAVIASPSGARRTVVAARPTCMGSSPARR